MNEKVLVVNTAGVEKVACAIETISYKLFKKPIITVLCTDEFADAFRQNKLVSSVYVYNPKERFYEIFKLLINMRKRRYDVVAILYCLDTKRYVIKSLPFLFGTKRVLIFNENLDCSFASLRFLCSFLHARLKGGTLSASLPACKITRLPVQIIFFPFVFLYLVLNTGLMTLRKYSRIKDKK